MNPFVEASGYPSWENYIPSLKVQTLIMCIMSQLTYQANNKFQGAVTDEFNYFTELGTTVFFTAKGKYKVVQPDSGAERVRVSYADESLVSRYYQFPIPGVDPKKKDFDFDSQYKIGLPPVYNCGPPYYYEAIPCPPPATQGPDSITYCAPNPGQPFSSTNILNTVVGANVFGYFKPPTPFCEDDPFVIAFHCIENSRSSTNNAFDTVLYFQFQCLAIRMKGVIGKDFGDGVDLVDAEGYLIDKYGNRISVITQLNEVDTFPTFNGVTNPTFGYNLTYNTFVFSFRGSVFLPDFLEEIVPPEILIPDLELSNPPELLARYRPWLVNKATAMYKSIAKNTNFDYFLSPFPEEQSIRIVKNYAHYLGSICMTGHSYGGSLANILAQYLVDRFPLYVNAQTYTFAPVPFYRPDAPPIDPKKYEGYLYIRAYTNNNDAVPFLKVPNFLNEPQDYVQPLQPEEIYHFFRIVSTCKKTYIERIKSYCFPNGGVPVYLSLNKDHQLSDYIGNLKKVNSEQFTKTVLGTEGVEDFTISNAVLIKTLLESVTALGGYGSNATNVIGADPLTNPGEFLYRFIGFNKLDVNCKNLIESLKL